MIDVHPSSLTMPRVAILVLSVCIFTLGFVLVMQFGFDYQPCVLCLWQRVPFVVAGLFALIALLWKPYDHHRSSLLMALCAITFFVNSGLALFHSGVERHWWLGTSGCSITPLHGTSVESIRDELLHMAVAHCDEISWTFLGLSMANYNVPFCFGLALFCTAAFMQLRQTKI